MKKVIQKLSLVISFLALLLFCACKGGGYKLNEPVTTKKGLKVTLNNISELKSVGTEQPKPGNVFVLVEYTVENPSTATIEDMTTAGLLNPDKQAPDQNFTASMEYEKEHPEKYANNYRPDKSRIYEAGKIHRDISIYEIPETDWKKEGWKSRILGDKGFQVMGPVK